ncbi:hypothetical protein [Arthrobacter sp. JSM 101049]|uniref:hypothetical protein n=1 Tax=Arthrobacter sp. JSM 101049 TaxID=929097 RepID=UPI0035629A0C
MHDEEPDPTYTTIEGVPYVRLFVDHGESPVWTWEPLDYAELQLPAELETRMRTWEAAFYALGPEAAGPGPAAQRHRAEGILLAGQLAGELGSPLAVHYASADPRAGHDVDIGYGVDGGEVGQRPSLADPAIFHVGTFPVRPAVSGHIAWMVQHPFEQHGDDGAGALDADWSDLADGDGPDGNDDR